MARASRVAPRRRHGVLLALLALVLLGLHASHLPVVAGRHPGFGEGAGSAHLAAGTARDEHRVAVEVVDHFGSTRQAREGALGPGALEAPMGTTTCLAETVAMLPRTSFWLPLGIGVVLLVVVPPRPDAGWPVEMVRPPPADRRRALLQVYLN